MKRFITYMIMLAGLLIAGGCSKWLDVKPYDKISEEEKQTIQVAVDKLKEVNKGTDVEAIKAATEEVQKAFYAVSEKLYKNAAPQGEAQNGDDNVVDADYETVD